MSVCGWCDNSTVDHLNGPFLFTVSIEYRFEALELPSVPQRLRFSPTSTACTIPVPRFTSLQSFDSHVIAPDKLSPATYISLPCSWLRCFLSHLHQTCSSSLHQHHNIKTRVTHYKTIPARLFPRFPILHPSTKHGTAKVLALKIR